MTYYKPAFRTRYLRTISLSCFLCAFLPTIAHAEEAQKTTIKSQKKKPAPKSKAKRLHNTSHNTEHILVTGTRLSQTRLTNVMAGSSVDAQQLRKRGYTDLGLALMRENTAFSIGDNSPIGAQGAYGAGQSFVSLLGLGSQRTLTLVDGMRMTGGTSASIFAAGAGSQVDVSEIPTSLVKKIDTRLGGAGAAYGADAVAGVVNYQLDDHFSGVDITGQGNWTQQLDAPQEKVTFKAGTDFDQKKGHIVFDFEYRGAGGVLDNARPNITGRDALTYDRVPYGTTSPYTRILIPNRRFIQNSITGVPMVNGAYGNLPFVQGQNGFGIPNAAGQPMMFNRNGSALIPITYQKALSNGLYASGGNGISLKDYGQLYAPSQKYNITTLGHYDITDHLHASWQGWYARGTSSNQVGQGTWSTPEYDDPLSQASYLNDSVVNGAFQLSTNNPYLTKNERSQIVSALKAAGQPTDTFYLSRLNQDLDAGLYRTTMQMFRFQGGLTGDFNALNRHFDWSVKGEYGQYLNDTWQPAINIQNLTNALNATTNAQGAIICAPGAQNSPGPSRSQQCAPLNPFGTGQISQQARDYVLADTHARNHNTQRDLQAEIKSTIVRLPAGPIRWDLGYEHRREGYNFKPDTFLRGNANNPQSDGSPQRYGPTVAMTDTKGSYETHEAFGELDVPFISPKMHLPGAYSLSGTANGRFIHNSKTGNYWTYMFGGAWWPTQDFGLSGNYAQSVRNPSVTEMFSPQASAYDSDNDPCSIGFVNAGPNPAMRAANCARSGIPSGGFNSQINYSTVPGKSGGNPHLQNETSSSYTGTLELRPHWVPGFDLTASFVDVKIKNEITSLGIGDLMNACYDSNLYCNTFSRDPSSHQITGYTEGYYNIANQHMQVLQATLAYGFPLSRVGLSQESGALELRGNYTHYLRNSSAYLSNNYLGTGDTGSPNDLFTLSLNYMRGPLFVQWQTIYYGPSKYKLQVASNAYEHNNRPDFAYFNTTIGYQLTKHFDINFMMNNVTNALPRYPGTVSMTRYYEALMGRSFELNIGAHF